MTTIDDVFGGKYLKAADLQRPVVYTISDAKVESFTAKDNSQKNKVVLSFKETEKQLVVNKTNGARIADITKSRVIEEWLGFRVMLLKDKVPFGGSLVDSISVSAPV